MRAGRSSFVLAMLVAGCHSTSVEVVRSLASFDFSCAEDKIQVTPTRDKGTFHADGCGKSANYTCEGWDSYSQKPICGPSR
jgi:hypothetical protein